MSEQEVNVEPLDPFRRKEEVVNISHIVQRKKPHVVKMGKSGGKASLICNFVRMIMTPDQGFYEYEVSFDPLVESKSMRSILLKQHEEAIGYAKIFDGVTLHLPFDLKYNKFESVQPVTNKEIVVNIMFRQKRQPSDCVNLYNVLMRRIFRILGMAQVNKNFFNPSSSIELTDNLQLWNGRTMEVANLDGGVMLCSNECFRVLRTTTVLEELVEMSKKILFFKAESLFIKAATERLVGLSVLTRYNNKTYRIDEILFDEDPMSTFLYQGSRITYVDYYMNRYGIDIKDKGQPLLLNRTIKKVNGKEEIIRRCLIPELSYLTGLDESVRSNLTIMGTLATHTRVTPSQRQLELENFVNLMRTNPTTSRILSDSGLSLESNCLPIEGRHLKKQQIMLKNSSFFPNSIKFDWSSKLMTDILVPTKITSWILVCVDSDQQNTRDFKNCLIDVSKRMGISFGDPNFICLPNTETYVNRIRDEILREPRFRLVVCVFPSKHAKLYSDIKTLCTAELGISSQFVTSKKISPGVSLRSLAQRIALQINCKMGGKLWAVHIPIESHAKMMVCGIDVYHDPARHGRSVVGFVASTNATMTSWYSRAKFLKQGVNMVDTMHICLMECLQKYFETNSFYPEEIVIFRNGVSDRQLPFCAEHEVPKLKSAFQSMLPRPRFTMVVVQKRTNARFFKVTPNGPVNPSPGTVIDHTVTRRDWWDYFLFSSNRHLHKSTVTPTHYVVVHDGKVNADTLQELTFRLTLMYYNWYGPVDVPAPCLYANKLAHLVGEYIRKDVKEELCDRLFFL